MSNNVTQVFSGDTSQIEKAYDRMLGKLEKLTAATEKLTNQSMAQSKKVTEGVKEQDSAFSSAFAAVGSKLATMAAGYLTLSAAIGVVTKSLQEQKRVQEESIGAAEKLAKIDAALKNNLNQGEDFNAARSRVLGMMARFGISDFQHASMVIRSSLAAAGGRAAGLDSAEAAFGITAKTPEESASTAFAHQSLLKLNGINNTQASNLIASGGASQPFANQGDFAQRAVATSVAARMYYKPNIPDVEMAKQHIAMTSLYHWAGATPEVASTGALGMEAELNDIFDNNPQLAQIDPGDTQGRWDLLIGNNHPTLQRLVDRLLKDLPEDAPGRQVTRGIHRQVASGRLRAKFGELRAGLQDQGNAFAEMQKGVLRGTPALEMDTESKRGQVMDTIALGDMTMDQRLENVRKNYQAMSKAGVSYAPWATFDERNLAGPLGELGASVTGRKQDAAAVMMAQSGYMLSDIKASGKADAEAIKRLEDIQKAIEAQTLKMIDIEASKIKPPTPEESERQRRNANLWDWITFSSPPEKPSGAAQVEAAKKQ